MLQTAKESPALDAILACAAEVRGKTYDLMRLIDERLATDPDGFAQSFGVDLWKHAGAMLLGAHDGEYPVDIVMANSRQFSREDFILFGDETLSSLIFDVEKYFDDRSSHRGIYREVLGECHTMLKAGYSRFPIWRVVEAAEWSIFSKLSEAFSTKYPTSESYLYPFGE